MDTHNPESGKKARPNVVIITLDECKASAMSPYGNAWASTPAALAMQRRGVMLDNAFCPFPKCVPSRAGLFSGRWPYEGGHRTLPGFELRADEPNLAACFKDAGYRTAMFGKNHTMEESLAETLFDERNGTHRSRIPLQEASKAMHLDNPLWRAFYRGRWRDLHDDEHQDWYDAEAAIDYLHRSTQQPDPFFLVVNLSLPHPVYMGMSPYIEQLDTMDVQLPSIEPLSETSQVLQAYRQVYGTESLSDADRLKIVKAYLSMVSYADHLVSGILQTLDDLALTESTIVVYTSDHGDFAGEHGSYEKYDTLFYDCLVHVPLFIQYPVVLKPGRFDALVQTIDVMPTILELAGLPINMKIHGKSLLPLLTGVTAAHRSCVFCDGGVERDAIDRAPHYDSEACARMLPNYYLKQKVLVEHPQSMMHSRMVRTTEWKYVHRLNGFHELYNLTKDPGELQNVYGQYPEAVNLLRSLLLDHALESDLCDPPIGNLYA